MEAGLHVDFFYKFKNNILKFYIIFGKNLYLLNGVFYASAKSQRDFLFILGYTRIKKSWRIIIFHHSLPHVHNFLNFTQKREYFPFFSTPVKFIIIYIY